MNFSVPLRFFFLPSSLDAFSASLPPQPPKGHCKAVLIPFGGWGGRDAGNASRLLGIKKKPRLVSAACRYVQHSGGRGLGALCSVGAIFSV